MTASDRPLRHRRAPGARAITVVAAVAGLSMMAPAAAPAQTPGGDEAAPRTAVTGVRVSQLHSFTRLTIALTSPVRFRVAAHGAPYRLVIDLPSLDWRLAETIPVAGAGLVREIAFSERAGGTAQVVAAIRGPFQIEKTFALRPHGRAQSWRLVVDLKPISRDAFDRQHGARRSETRQKQRATIPDLAPQGPRGAPLIVIDPGHGGVDTGAISRWGLLEKDVVLSFAKTLSSALLATGRYRVLLTRSTDIFLPLRMRYEIARKFRADMFMSIHADSNRSRYMRGLSVHTLSTTASDRLAARLARRENKSDLIAGVDLADQSASVRGILIDLVRRETMAASIRLAKAVVRETGRVTRLLPDPRRSARFVVLKAPEVPSVLIELGFLTNRKDERLLRDGSHMRVLAGALVHAVNRYFRTTRRRPQTAREPAAGANRNRE